MNSDDIKLAQMGDARLDEPEPKYSTDWQEYDRYMLITCEVRVSAIDGDSADDTAKMLVKTGLGRRLENIEAYCHDTIDARDAEFGEHEIVRLQALVAAVIERGCRCRTRVNIKSV